MLLAAAALTLAAIDLNRKKRSGALCVVCVMLGAHQVTHTHKTAHPPEGSNWGARTKNLSHTQNDSLGEESLLDSQKRWYKMSIPIQVSDGGARRLPDPLLSHRRLGR
jgi:hypothetical protein